MKENGTDKKRTTFNFYLLPHKKHEKITIEHLQQADWKGNTGDSIQFWGIFIYRFSMNV